MDEMTVACKEEDLQNPKDAFKSKSCLLFRRYDCICTRRHLNNVSRV